MSPIQAKELLSLENIRTTCLVLAALDHLQEGEFFATVQKALKKRQAHSEAQIVELAEKSIEGFVLSQIPGNGVGLKMNLSSFLNGLQLLHMLPEMAAGMEACAKFETNSPQES